MDIKISLNDLLNKKGGNSEMNNLYIDKVVRDFLDVKVVDLAPSKVDESSIEVIADFVEFLTGNRNRFNTKYIKAIEWLNSDVLDFPFHMKCIKNNDTLLYVSSIGEFYKRRMKGTKREIQNFLSLNVSEYVEYVTRLPGWKKEWYSGDIKELVQKFEAKLKKGYKVYEVLSEAFGKYEYPIPQVIILNDASEEKIPQKCTKYQDKYSETCIISTLIWFLMVYGPLAVYEDKQIRK